MNWCFQIWSRTWNTLTELSTSGPSNHLAFPGSYTTSAKTSRTLCDHARKHKGLPCRGGSSSFTPCSVGNDPDRIVLCETSGCSFAALSQNSAVLGESFCPLERSILARIDRVALRGSFEITLSHTEWWTLRRK